MKNKFIFIIFILLSSCMGGVESKDAPSNYYPPGSSAAFYEKDAFGVTESRRLTRFEISNSLEDIFDLPLGADASLLPEDIASNTHFDNTYQSQSISPLIVSNYISFAESYSERLIAQSNFVQNFAKCSPRNSGDLNCLIKIISKAGRLLLRRSLSSSETSTIANKFAPLAIEDGDFLTGVQLSLFYLIANPEFIYRLEGGSTPSQTYELNSFEVASRMSFMLWGAGPDEELLQAAESGELDSSTSRAQQAFRILTSPKSKRQWHRFHAQWLGYSEAALPSTYQNDLNKETHQLLDEVIFNSNRNWLDIFNYNKTYVSPQLAQFYNMPSVPRSSQWVDYTGQRGGGILAHGAFLSLGAKFNDTSPTIRGYEIFKRLACGELGPAPSNVDVDTPPGTPGDCKVVRYHMRKTQSCKSCHSITDNIGFGLENYGVFGKWRDREPSNSSCSIDNRGNWFGKTYSGPKELGDIISRDQNVVNCSSKQLFRFLMGRKEESQDQNTLNALNVLRASNSNLKSILVEFVKSPAIKYRKGN